MVQTYNEETNKGLFFIDGYLPLPLIAVAYE